MLPSTRASKATPPSAATASTSTTTSTSNDGQTQRLTPGSSPPNSEGSNDQSSAVLTPSSTTDSNGDIPALKLGSPALPARTPVQATRLGRFTRRPLPPLVLRPHADPVFEADCPWGVLNIHLEMVPRESVWTSTTRDSRGWKDGWFNRYDGDGRFRGNVQGQPPIGMGRPPVQPPIGTGRLTSGTKRS